MSTSTIWEILPPWASFMIIVMTSFFALVDPLGNITIFHAYTQDLPQKVSNYIARRSCFIACALTIFFAFLGDYVFDLFGLTLNGLKIAGGIIFFLIGYDMLRAKISSIKVAKNPSKIDKEKADELAISPLAIPLLCGPGVIVNTIILMGEAGNSLSHKIAFVSGVCIIFIFTFFCFLKTNSVVRLIGKSGSKVILSLMGLFMMILAVQYFFEGLTPVLRDIFKLT